ncbi:MAG TPA: hypothetical protein VF834_12225 [Streptosporangiaceae bacterium]
MLAAACSGGASEPSAIKQAEQAQSPRPTVLRATWTPYQLPSAISAATAVARHGQLIVAGGMTGSGAPASGAAVLDPLTGQERPAGRLARPVAGAGAALLHGRLVLFGGRAGHSISGVQVLSGTGKAAMSPRLPQARSGLATVTAGGSTFLIGGTNRGGPLASVLKTTDGVHYVTAATLPVPVSQTGAVVAAGSLWVFGGVTSSGLTSAIQRVDLRTGRATVAGRLPAPVAAESVFVLHGQIYLAGGRTEAATGGHGTPARVGTSHSRPNQAQAAQAGKSRAGQSHNGLLHADPPGTGQARQGPASSTTDAILRFDPASRMATVAGRLPMPTANAASAVVGSTAYLVGGTDGVRASPAVVAVRQVPPGDALPGTIGASPRLAPWLAPVSGPGHLAPGSDPAALPADVLVADHLNNRLVIIDPQGRVRWVFPRPGDLARGQTFLVPDDAFFSPDGRYIVATQEDDQVISVIDVARHKIVYRYGKPGVPGSGPNRLSNPDDAMMLPNGDIVAADIRNCRIIVIAPPAHRLIRVIGRAGGGCWHDPPWHFGSPNGAFPTSSGGYVVTEINGDWADGLNLTGHVRWATNPPGVLYPSDTNEVYPGRYLTADYSNPGQVAEFNSAGRLLWRFGGLNQPSLAIPLPNGNVLLNDDFNHRIIVVNPADNRILWQYGHTGKPGRAPGYLNVPDGLDLVPPDSFLIRHAATMGMP